jgi:hypothetical protein
MYRAIARVKAPTPEQLPIGFAGADELGGSLTLGRAGLPGLPHHKKIARSESGKNWSISPPSPIAAL